MSNWWQAWWYNSAQSASVPSRISRSRGAANSPVPPGLALSVPHRGESSTSIGRYGRDGVLACNRDEYLSRNQAPYSERWACPVSFKNGCGILNSIQQDVNDARLLLED